MRNTELELDKLLEFINKHSDGALRPYFTDGELIKLIAKEKPDLSGNEAPNNGYEIMRMIRKLIKDGYIESEEKKEWNMTSQSHVITGINYYITHEGRCFEGYIEKNKKEHKDRNEIRDLRMTTLYLTWILAISAGIASLYYLTKGFLWFCCH